MYTIAEAKVSIRNGIRGYLAKKDNGGYVMKEVNRLPFYLEGEPGIGKTEIVKQIAEELGLGYVSFSLVHHTRNSLLGLPVIKELEDGDKYTSYTMSEIIAKVQEAVAAGYKEGILLLDEFPCMSETIMPAMLAFLQTKNIGTHHLPEGWVIVLCGNPQEYNKASRMFDAAIVDRIRKLEIQFEPKAFLSYGEQIGLHECILDYLEENPRRAYHYEKDKGRINLVTCRGWENLSYMLKAYEEMEIEITSEDVKQYLKYEEVAVDFVQYYAQCSLGLRKADIKNILSGIDHPRYIKMLKNAGINKKWRSVKSIMAELKSRCEENKKQEDFFSAIREFGEIVEEFKEDLPQTASELWNKEILPGMSYDDIVTQTTYWWEIYGVLPVSLEMFEDGISDMLIKAWMEWSLKENRVCEDKEGMDAVLYVYNEWKDFRGKELLDEKQKLMKYLENMMIFAEKLDTENALMEMLFCAINGEEDMLYLLKENPNKQYLKICKKWYGAIA